MSEMVNRKDNRTDAKRNGGESDFGTKLAQSRESMYRFLSRLYLLEIDEQMLESLLEIQFPKECPEEDLEEGYGLIQNYLTDAKARLEQNQPGKGRKEGEQSGTGREAALQEILDELAVDYARIFLSAGVAQGKAAFPYASVYTSRQHLMMQDSRNDAAALFAGKGLAPRKDMYRVPEDHLGLLLEYMAVLCRQEAGQEVKKQAETENTGSATESRAASEAAGKSSPASEQADFLKNQLLNWTAAFTADVVKYASTDFYRGLGKLTKGFLALERSLLLER